MTASRPKGGRSSLNSISKPAFRGGAKKRSGCRKEDGIYEKEARAKTHADERKAACRKPLGEARDQKKKKNHYKERLSTLFADGDEGGALGKRERFKGQTKQKSGSAST